MLINNSYNNYSKSNQVSKSNKSAQTTIYKTNPVDSFQKIPRQISFKGNEEGFFTKILNFLTSLFKAFINIFSSKEKPDAIKSDPIKTEEIKLEQEKPDVIKSDPIKSEEIKPEQEKPDAIKSDPIKAEEIKPEQKKPDAVKSTSKKQIKSKSLSNESFNLKTAEGIEKAYQYAKKIIKNPSMTLKTANELNNIGESLVYIKEHEKAQEILESILTLSKDEKEQTKSSFFLAINALSQGQLKNADKYIYEAPTGNLVDDVILKHMDKIKENFSEESIEFSYVSILASGKYFLNKPQKAIDMIKPAMRYLLEKESDIKTNCLPNEDYFNLRGKAESLFGYACFESKQMDFASEALNNSITSHFKAGGDPMAEKLMSTYSTLGDIYSQLSNKIVDEDEDQAQYHAIAANFYKKSLAVAEANKKFEFVQMLQNQINQITGKYN